MAPLWYFRALQQVLQIVEGTEDKTLTLISKGTHLNDESVKTHQHINLAMEMDHCR
jgi:hypothetical protein